MIRYGWFICIGISMLYLCINQVDIAPLIEQCTQTYNASSGHTCRFCPPGTHKHSDCDVDGGNALCVTCSNGTYQHYCNRADSCAICAPRCIQPYTVMVKGCTLYNNIVCECEEGRYMDPGQVCLTHSKCSAGFGMVKLGDKQEDTECKECVYGQTYSNGESFERCSICTKCLEYITTCSTTEDAKCSLPWEDTSTKSSSTTETNPGKNYSREKVIAAAVSSGVLVLLAVICITIYIVRRLNRKGKYPTGTENGKQQPNGHQANGEDIGLLSESDDVQPLANEENSQREVNGTHVDNGVETGQISFPKANDGPTLHAQPRDNGHTSQSEENRAHDPNGVGSGQDSGPVSPTEAGTRSSNGTLPVSNGGSSRTQSATTDPNNDANRPQANDGPILNSQPRDIGHTSQSEGHQAHDPSGVASGQVSNVESGINSPIESNEVSVSGDTTTFTPGQGEDSANEDDRKTASVSPTLPAASLSVPSQHEIGTSSTTINLEEKKEERHVIATKQW